MKIGLSQSLVDPASIGAKRTAALQDEGNTFERRTLIDSMRFELGRARAQNVRCGHQTNPCQMSGSKPCASVPFLARLCIAAPQSTHPRRLADFPGAAASGSLSLRSSSAAAWYLRLISARSTVGLGNDKPSSSIVSATIRDTAKLRNHL